MDTQKELGEIEQLLADVERDYDHVNDFRVYSQKKRELHDRTAAILLKQLNSLEWQLSNQGSYYISAPTPEQYKNIFHINLDHKVSIPVNKEYEVTLIINSIAAGNQLDIRSADFQALHLFAKNQGLSVRLSKDVKFRIKKMCHEIAAVHLIATEDDDKDAVRHVVSGSLRDII